LKARPQDDAPDKAQIAELIPDAGRPADKAPAPAEGKPVTPPVAA
jgi:hypothetical protein